MIDVDTTVSPFAYARSETQLLGDPKIAPRTLELRGDEGWIEVGDKRSKMPEAMETHERLQYATYGLMRLVSLRDEGATIALVACMRKLLTIVNARRRDELRTEAAMAT